jgi:hypothetical protein
LAGGASGAALGLLLGGPAGAVVGGATGPLITRVFHAMANELGNRVLAQREELRVGAAFAFAAERIRRNLEEGRTPRQDEFFRSNSGGRASAEELLEGVLMAAQREHEEAKIRHYGMLIANLAFRPDVSRPRANALLRSAERLSYRQLVLLSLFSTPVQPQLRERWYEDDEWVDDEVYSVLHEIYDMYLLGLVRSREWGLMSPSQIAPSRMYAWSEGELLSELMEVGSVPVEDREEVARILRIESGTAPEGLTDQEEPLAN